MKGTKAKFIDKLSNDYGFEYIFSRQVEAHLRKGDLLIALSTSGRSKNILEALKTAVEMNVDAMLWMGDFEVNFNYLSVIVLVKVTLLGKPLNSLW